MVKKKQGGRKAVDGKRPVRAPEAEKVPSAEAAEAAAEPGRKGKRRKLSEYTPENDMKYRGPLNYQGFQLLGWACMVLSVVVLVIRLGGKLDPSVTESYDGLAVILALVSDLSLPFLLIANFSRILNNSEGYKKQLLRNGGAALAIFLVTIGMGSRYFVGTLQQVVVQKDEIVPMLASFFRSVNHEGFLAFNLFIDLFLCTLTMFFLNARPKRVFTGKKVLILRLFALLPVAYELACLYMKIQSARGRIELPLWCFPLLTVKPPMTFAFFVFIALLVSIREYRYCRHGRTHEEYLDFMKTNRNSFHLSVHFCISMIVFALIDAVLFFSLSLVHAASVTAYDAAAEAIMEAMNEGARIALAVGIGGSIMLAAVAPLMLLYSYNAQPKRKIISTLAPAVGISLMVLVVLEAVRMGAGMYMRGREIDLNLLRQSIADLL